MRKHLPAVVLSVGLAFVGGGAFGAVRGVQAKDQIRTELAAEGITTPDDASIPGVLVDSAKTAESQAKIIQEHALKSTGGKTYAQMKKDDPKRSTALTAATLRSALYSSVLAFALADLVIGLGAFVMVVGLVFVALGVTLRRLQR